MIFISIVLFRETNNQNKGTLSWNKIMKNENRNTPSEFRTKQMKTHLPNPTVRQYQPKLIGTNLLPISI